MASSNDKSGPGPALRIIGASTGTTSAPRGPEPLADLPKPDGTLTPEDPPAKDQPSTVTEPRTQASGQGPDSKPIPAGSSEPKARSADEIIAEQQRLNAYNKPLSQPKAPKPTAQRIGGTKKPCNYIFTVGKAGSGKTTFQSHLLRYLTQHDEHHAEPDPEFTRDDSVYQTYRSTVAKWQKKWINGEFPDRNFIGQVVEIRLVVEPVKPAYKANRYPTIPFGFLEISGEDFKSLIDAGESLPSLMPSLDAFLNSTQHKISIVFVCQGDNMGEDDFLFSQFLEYLDRKVSPEFKKNCNAVLVLANPDACAHRLADALGREFQNEPLDQEAFVRFFTPSTFQKLKQWGQRAAIAPFAVGAIEEVVDANGALTRRLVTPSFRDVGLIYEWLYERFTDGVRPQPKGPTLLRRTKESCLSL